MTKENSEKIEKYYMERIYKDYSLFTLEKLRQSLCDIENKLDLISQETKFDVIHIKKTIEENTKEIKTLKHNMNDDNGKISEKFKDLNNKQSDKDLNNKQFKEINDYLKKTKLYFILSYILIITLIVILIFK